MVISNYPNNEEERLQALASYHLLDTLPEEEFDNITYLASVICQTPISLITLVDKDRQFFKSHLGLDVSETNRDISFCAHAINQPQTIFEIEDARLDHRFHDNELVRGKPNIVFYAGIPLITNDGFALGTLCVIDNKPRTLTYEQKEALTRLSKQVMLILEARQKSFLENKIKLFDFTFRNSSMPTYYILEDGSFYDFNESACKQLGYLNEELQKLSLFDIDNNFDKKKYALLLAELKEKGKLSIETIHKRKDGIIIDVIVNCNYVKYGEKELICCYVLDITEKKNQEHKMRILDHAYRNTDSAMSFLLEDGSFMNFNKATANMLGYTFEEFFGKKIMDVNPIINNEYWAERWADLKEGQNQIVQTRFKKKDGSLIDVEVNTKTIDLGGVLVNFGLYTDITAKLALEKRLKIVDFSFRNANIAMHFWRRDGSIYDYNEANCKLFGFTNDEFKKVSIFDLSFRHTPDSWEARFQEFKIGPNNPYITPLRKKDNSLVYVEIRSEIIVFEDEELCFSSLIDITEKLKSEKDLKQSIKRYEEATNATSDVIWEADILNKEIFISKNFTTLFGHQVEDGWMPMENNIWRQNIHPEEVEMVLKNQYQVLNANSLNDNWKGEYRLRKADGNYAIVYDRTFGIKDENGNVIRMVGAMHDITTRKEEEARLKLMESVILNSTDSVLITDTGSIKSNDPQILFVNPAFEKMTGYSKEEIIGKTPRILQNEDTDRKELQKLIIAFKNCESCEITISNSRKNGEKYWVNLRIIPITNEMGTVTHWIALERDVTNQIEAEKEKEKLLKELMENNLELKQFSYITSHNLRAPITNLVAICKLIKTEKITDDLTLKLIEGFKNTTNHLNGTLNDLIEILIIKENRNLQTNQLNFSDVLKKVDELLSISLLEMKVSVQVDFSEAPTVIFTNSYLESIFINLFTNAIKYRHPDRDPVISIKSSKELNGDTKLIFSDNGIGINMTNAKGKIFGLYSRFHRNADSKGIGLYLIHSQITALGGSIEVESEVNIGTKFIITFK